MTIKYLGNAYYIGLSGDTKPTSGVVSGARFFETDTGALYYYISSTWTRHSPSNRTISQLDGFLQFTPVSDPGAPGGNSRRLYVDSTANHLFLHLPNDTTIDIEEIATQSGEANTMTNEGTGAEIFMEKEGVNFKIRSLAEGASDTITITPDPGGTLETGEILFDINSSNVLLQNLGGTLLDTQLPTNVFLKDEDNDVGDHYIDFGDITPPASPSANFRRLFCDSSNNDELSIKKSDGSVVSLEAAAAGSGVINDASNEGAAGVGLFITVNGDTLEFKNINAGSSKISVTDDSGGTAPNYEVDIDVVEANLNLESIGGSISTRSKLPSTVVYDDETNTFGDLDQIFRSSRLLLRDSDNSHSYILAGSNLSANRTITFPLLTGDDTLVTEAFSQTLTNKTINASNNTITNIGDSQITTHTTTKITTTNKSLLNTSIMYEDEDNNVGAHYLNISEIAAPAQPSANNARLFLDSTSGRLTVKKDDNSVKDIEIKQYPFVLVNAINNSTANWTDGRSAPFATTRWNGSSDVTKITARNTMVITRFTVGVSGNTKNGTTTFDLRDDGSAVTGTSTNVSATTNGYFDSGAISQTIASGSEIEFASNTSASSSGTINYTMQVWGYYELT